MVDKKTNRGLELIRFLICGAVAALFDYLACQLMVLALHNALNEVWTTVISTAIGFIVGVTVNYLISTFWVYQNVDKSIQTKSKKFIALFVALSLAGLFLSIGAMLLCNLVVMAIWGAENNIVNLSVMELIKTDGIKFLTKFIFWAYFFSFCVKTIVGFVFNYFTRKFILYKEPKENLEEKE